MMQGMVPESHAITVNTTDELAEYFTSAAFRNEVVDKLRSQYEVDIHVNGLSSASAADEAQASETESLTLSYTRNNAGGLKDAIDFLTSQLVAHGLDATTVRGAIPRPKSDSFEDNLPFFESKLLHRAEPNNATDSPTRSAFGDDGDQRSFFDKLRKPGSISSFLDRRKNGSNTPGSFMKNASSNASKASLASLESTGSGYRNPWNDSGVNLPDDDNATGWPARFSAGSSDNKFPFGVNTGAAGSTTSLNTAYTPLPPPGSSGSAGATYTPVSGHALTFSPGDTTPKFGDSRVSHDSGRPSTSNSTLAINEYPADPIALPATAPATP